LSDAFVIFEAADLPEKVLDQQLQIFSSGSLQQAVFAVKYLFEQYYLSPVSSIELVALVELSGNVDGVNCRVTITNDVKSIEPLASMSGITLNKAADIIQQPIFTLEQPLQLKPVAIPKPWGQEIWYTGIEERGLSEVTDGSLSIPLPWLLAFAPGRLAKYLHRQLNLLKILDPLPDEVYGDLYFELHEKKQEVYVVTNVDKTAWPDGAGAIRFGFDRGVRSEFESDDEFKLAYMTAVANFQTVRKEVDGLIDQLRVDEDIALNEPVSAEKLKHWHQTLPQQLVQQEAVLRSAMERFSAIKPLEVGDVVTVPTLTPHSLQHGVRTVEFQTPVYERKILSFGQKVLTQSDWDTAEAAELMSLESPELLPLPELLVTDDCLIEQVVKFDDFLVRRITLAGGKTWSLGETGNYALLMSVNGGVRIEGCDLSAEQALMVPACRSDISVESLYKNSTILLVAEPI
jgi:hypothetical protein